MNDKISKLQQAIAPYREQLINHPVYNAINSLEDLRIFMEHHIYAVWDFMSLLKALQINLTCTQVPWFPVGSAGTRYLINEIVAGEESDVDETGERMSHYEMYLNAMAQCNASTIAFNQFVTVLQDTKSLDKAFDAAQTLDAVRDFVNYTFDTINRGKAHMQAAAFTYGREDLIPDMFHEIVKDLNHKFPQQVAKFNYYLERHIEVDGGHHSHLATEMTTELCGDDEQKWQEATEASINALQKRIGLWDGIYEDIQLLKKEPAPLFN
ncbi:DUF3050 domain-containing protein [Mucilaginibacter corticis]|uniref:DUF3050 domain-containing protein n=1 Tax=Mucilaginibacter corticis TaxID=2597670 RepID=A0A556ML27_9SPHI|nr:DUF3050 domain-containing protein [Mucilaginibacter corticis]TSJ40489.1 DUF3050 domain-containing protein [Mucilaginibacter corticis]